MKGTTVKQLRGRKAPFFIFKNPGVATIGTLRELRRLQRRLPDLLLQFDQLKKPCSFEFAF